MGTQRHVSPRFSPPAAPKEAAGPGVQPGDPPLARGEPPLASHFHFSFLTASCTTSLYSKASRWAPPDQPLIRGGELNGTPNLSRAPPVLTIPPSWGHPAARGFSPHNPDPLMSGSQCGVQGLGTVTRTALWGSLSTCHHCGTPPVLSQPPSPAPGQVLASPEFGCWQGWCVSLVGVTIPAQHHSTGTPPQIPFGSRVPQLTAGTPPWGPGQGDTACGDSAVGTSQAPAQKSSSHPPRPGLLPTGSIGILRAGHR